MTSNDTITNQITSIEEIFRFIQDLKITGDGWLEEIQEICRIGENACDTLREQITAFIGKQQKGGAL